MTRLKWLWVGPDTRKNLSLDPITKTRHPKCTFPLWCLMNLVTVISTLMPCYPGQQPTPITLSIQPAHIPGTLSLHSWDPIPIGKEFPDGLYPKFRTESIKPISGSFLKMWGRTWPLPPCPRQWVSWFGNGGPGPLSYTEKAMQSEAKAAFKPLL
jgi:hypothetical protein